MDPKIKEILDNYGERIEKLENELFKKSENMLKSENGLKGLPKGVQEMLDEGFFDTPKTVKEAKSELERKGHFGSEARVDTVIRRDFFNRKKILTRIKNGGSWKYTKLK